MSTAAPDEVIVFVDTVGHPHTHKLEHRRLSIRSMFPMNVFRFEVSKLLDRLPPERTRMWLVQPGVGEVLIDLNRTAKENAIEQGSKLLLEISNPDGSWLRQVNPLSTSQTSQYEDQSKKLFQGDEHDVPEKPKGSTGSVIKQAPPPTTSEQELAQALAIAQSLAIAPNPKKPAPAPATAAMATEEEQIKAAMALSATTQRSQLDKEESLNMALALIGLRKRKMRDDGNCLFHSLADQIWGDAKRAAELRQAVCAELQTNREYYEPFTDDDFDAYVATMSCDGTYATHLEIQAFANVFGKKVFVYSDESDTSSGVIEPIVITGAAACTPPPVRITYERGNHYNSVVPLDAPAEPEAPSVSSSSSKRAGGDQCPYCAAQVDDLDMHLVTTHAEMFE